MMPCSKTQPERLSDLHVLLMTTLLNVLGGTEDHVLQIGTEVLKELLAVPFLFHVTQGPGGRWRAVACGTAGLRLSALEEVLSTRADAISQWVAAHRGFCRLVDLKAGLPDLRDVLTDCGCADGYLAPLRTITDVFGFIGIAYSGPAPELDDHQAFVVHFVASHLALEIERVRTHCRLNGALLLLRRWWEVHNRLTRLVLEDRGLPAILSELTDLVGLPVEVRDQAGKVLARSEPRPEARRTVRVEREPLELAAIGAGCTPGRTLPQGRAERVTVPVQAGRRVLGYLVIESRSHGDDLARIAAEHAATIVALELVKLEAARQAEERLKGSFIDSLLRGEYLDAEGAIDHARRLGLDLVRPHRVAVVTAAGSAEGEGGEAALLRAVQAAARDLCAAVFVAERSGQLVLLVPESSSAASTAPELVGRLLPRAEASLAQESRPVKLYAGLGRICTSPDVYAESYRQARFCLQLRLRHPGLPNVLEYERLGIYRLLESVPAEQVIHFLGAAFNQLRRYDRSGELQATLEVFLDEACNLQATARRLFVHVGTVRYRLRRIAEVTGLDLDDPEVRLCVHLAVKLGKVATDRP